MSRITWALLAAALLAAPSAALAEERYAVVIGANVGWANDKPLRHAESDAEHVRDVLVELGGFSADRVHLLRDPDTTEVRALLRKVSGWLRAGRGDTLLFVYYSGHADARHLHLRGEPMSHEELYAMLRDSPGRVRLGVVDACRSGSIVDTKGGRPVATFESQVVDELEVNGLALLTSSGADELSQERRALAGSVFTHHLVSGLRGAADANEDGRVTLSEAYQHAFQRTEADTAATPVPQRPAFRYELKGQGEVVLTWLERASATLVLPRVEGERYVVVDRAERRLAAEGRTRPERELPLALAPGDYHVKRVGAESVESAAVKLEAGARVAVSGLAFEPRPLSSGLLKGRPEDTSDPAELRDWRRDEALRLLAAGEARAALRLFDQVLKEVPDDAASLRGRARGLVRLAEAYERTGDKAREHRALRAAIAADPTLPEDPDFLRRYQQLQEEEATQAREEAQRAEALLEFQRNPRLGRIWGVGLDLFSSRGVMVIAATYVARKDLFPYVALDIGFGGIDAGTRWSLVNSRFSPFLGAGVHVGVPGLESDNASIGVGGNTITTDPKRPGDIPAEEVFNLNLHLDAGLQYVAQGGFFIDAGLGLAIYPKDGSPHLQLLPIIGAGWLF
ncbi:caspase family protein [Pyxidicoccus sp. MSG2]|uniref:caspase family protein n=1 Tax=Pyxidicoccus sp. MSG2 TaxID=2996790 RepID=UPI00226F6C5E|nr:caspase family protein [Pyxidicoccus sp. MSG2]MCY1017438.1 caspase family protein [Pyxidicoccus sp. MSG2]